LIKNLSCVEAKRQRIENSVKEVFRLNEGTWLQKNALLVAVSSETGDLLDFSVE
jgi:hypothetical protein